ncbi:hypothetical protein OG887_19780 [Streptomyces sp. NBC_00053]|nr:MULTISPECIES: hypothetical protein [unclassified Streptomyces]MCX5501600.1 hypothetical protein [Streptomyces sp. NBC_00052]MCX5549865.1 hypothetical protein [Streptomyces sp. NBC_00051]WSG51865.1 hypothetical protein OHA38_19845 [Streptomyces sp. NBC_01732]
MTFREALTRQATVSGGDNGGHGADDTDIEDGDGNGGSGSPGH